MAEAVQGQAVLQARNISKHYRTGRNRPWSAATAAIRALDNVNLELRRGEILALVGESGCGKSTLALILMLLEKATQGQVLFEAQDMTGLKGKALRRLRRQMQMIFQDPYDSLNPTMKVGDVVAEPLKVHRLTKNRAELNRRVQQALADVGLSPTEDFVHRYPSELSGGQRQRVAIAAALVLEPMILLADEPVSMLDVSIRAEILNLFKSLCQERGISMLLISHDLSSVAQCADRIVVMYSGKIVEQGTTADLLSRPRHPYTQALLSAIPVTNPRLRRPRVILQGEAPDPLNLPAGCRFHPRCPLAIGPCAEVEPEWREAKPSHGFACHVTAK